jgi:hypothetical protein
MERQRHAVIVHGTCIMFVKGDQAARSYSAGELRYGLRCVGLIHQDSKPNGGVKRAVFWKNNIEPAFDERNIEHTSIASPHTGGFKHLRIAIHSKDVAIISNASREHERHGARSTADFDHAHAGADRRVIDHPLGHFIDSVGHGRAFSTPV